MAVRSRYDLILVCRGESGVYPGLISTEGGAISITLRCTHVKEEGDDYSVLLLDEDLTEALDGATQANLVPL